MGGKIGNYPLILHPALIINGLRANYPQIIRNYPTPKEGGALRASEQ